MTLSERTTQRSATGAQLWHLVTVLVIVASVVTQFVLTVQGKDVLPIDQGGTDSTPERIVRFFSYFTIQSNILVAFAVTPLVGNALHDGTGWRTLRYTSLLGITLTGVVYWTVLHWDVDLSGVRELTNYGLHAAAPILAFLGWLFFGPRPRVDLQTFWWALAWPAAWLVYILIFGEATEWYPYPFVDVDEEGYGTVLVNVVVIAAGVVAVSWLLRWLDGRLPAQPSP